MATRPILLVVVISLYGVALNNGEANGKDKLWSSLTPLQLAAMEGRAEDVKTILQEKRESVNGVTGLSPLHWAALRGHETVIHVLLKFGADIRSLDQKNNTALHMAAVSGSPRAIQELALAKVEINAQNSNNSTALHLAVDKGDLEAVKELLRFDALTNITDQEGRYPRDVAIEKGNFLMELLLKTVVWFQTGKDPKTRYDEMNTTPKPTLATTAKPPKVQFPKATRYDEMNTTPKPTLATTAKPPNVQLPNATRQF